MKIFVECKKAKDKDVLYHTLNIDIGYRTAILTMDKDTIVELADIKYSELYAMKEKDVIHIGNLVKK